MTKFEMIIESLKVDNIEVRAESIHVGPAFTFGKCQMCKRRFHPEENALIIFVNHWEQTCAVCLDRVACHASIAAKEAAKKQASAVRVSRVENEVRLPSDPTDGGDE